MMDAKEKLVSAEEARGVVEIHERFGGRGDDTAARLARTVVVLHAIIEGRTTPPTDDELAAHAKRGGQWMMLAPQGISADRFAWPSPRDWYVARGASRWWPLDRDGRPCAWPEVR